MDYEWFSAVKEYMIALIMHIFNHFASTWCLGVYERQYFIKTNFTYGMDWKLIKLFWANVTKMNDVELDYNTFNANYLKTQIINCSLCGVGLKNVT